MARNSPARFPSIRTVMIGPLRRRSSWPSSLATALIGWIGFTIVVPLALGYTGPLGELFDAAVICAVTQTVVLRLAFNPLGLNRSLLAGSAAGAISGAVLSGLCVALFPVVRPHPVIAIVTGVYIGGAVGIFLSYFHRDDGHIEAEALATGVPVDYGRDAHWLDPFVYGAVAYELALLPRTAEVAICAAVVGMIVGVVAAGVSHFFLSRWNNGLGTLLAATLAGTALGAASGLLFRNYASGLPMPPLTSGAAGGALTFLVTATVGRRLALVESGGVAAQKQT